MTILGILVALTIVAESYIIAYKMHLYKVKAKAFFINLLCLIYALIIALTVHENNSYSYSDVTIVVSGIALAGCIILAVLEWIFKLRGSINRNIVKTTVDNASSGILVLKNKDKIMFRNIIMYELLEKLGIHDDYISGIKQAAIDKMGRDYLVMIDDNAWIFDISRDGLEVTASDINEEYVLSKKIEEQNILINKNNEELAWTIDNLEMIEKEEQTLKIKNKFHDLLGQNLSVLQAYLNQDENNIEDEAGFSEIKFMIKRMFTELSDGDDAKENLNNLIRVNKNIGIDVIVDGKLPEDSEKSRVLFEVIREAVTNAVRHAQSDKVYVCIDNKADGITMTITNNGLKSKPLISESEGIRGMRRKIQSLNGSFSVTTEPEFIIKAMI